MKDYCLELVSKKNTSTDKINVMREYLQAYALKILHHGGFFRSAAFVGGTALRFLHGLPRYSEDLDFSSIQQGKMFSFVEIVTLLRDEFLQAGYSVIVTYNDSRTVFSAFVKFEGLMKEAGISPLSQQRLSIKIEIDTRPPHGAVLTTEIINKYFPLSLLTYDIPSLFAGKLHALVSRKYNKGRDFFDIGWYLSKWKELVPNIALLQNALSQTGWRNEQLNHENWRPVISEIISSANWTKIEVDVKNFLERPSDMDVFSKEEILRLIQGR
ncbi:MAG: nucleotidyl transferase AbiEii/AbiGii toxin family protein [Chitinivibrionales bacterium]|nr:nucleotidyl transferase AbiEii/AbiGii toxin family protein [Chitinivibrionales bacterium]